MNQFPCPWCGPRDETEFRCGGEASIARPDPASADATSWANYLFYRDNERGRVREMWWHAHGCGQWFVMTRDTLTHAVTGTSPRAAPTA